MALDVGARRGSHEILSVVDTGGIGAICDARDARLNRRAAISIQPPIQGDRPMVPQPFGARRTDLTGKPPRAALWRLPHRRVQSGPPVRYLMHVVVWLEALAQAGFRSRPHLVTSRGAR